MLPSPPRPLSLLSQGTYTHIHTHTRNTVRIAHSSFRVVAVVNRHTHTHTTIGPTMFVPGYLKLYARASAHKRAPSHNARSHRAQHTHSCVCGRNLRKSHTTMRDRVCGGSPRCATLARTHIHTLTHSLVQTNARTIGAHTRIHPVCARVCLCYDAAHTHATDCIQHTHTQAAIITHPRRCSR